MSPNRRSCTATSWYVPSDTACISARAAPYLRPCRKRLTASAVALAEKVLAEKFGSKLSRCATGLYSIEDDTMVRQDDFSDGTDFGDGKPRQERIRATAVTDPCHPCINNPMADLCKGGVLRLFGTLFGGHYTSTPMTAVVAEQPIPCGSFVAEYEPCGLICTCESLNAEALYIRTP